GSGSAFSFAPSQSSGLPCALGARFRVRPIRNRFRSKVEYRPSEMNNSRNTQPGRRAIFIDRDGTLNEEVGHICDPAQFRLHDFAAEAVRLVNEAGWLAIVITN